MPEGPEVRIVVDKIRLVKGLYFSHFELPIGKTGKIQTEILTKWAAWSNLFPSICLDVITRGKQIYFFLANGIAFNSGLGMEGHWLINSMDKWTEFSLVFGSIDPDKPDQLTRLVKLYYDDMRRHGNFYITDWQTAFNKMIHKYGPDFLTVKHPMKNIHPYLSEHLPKEYFLPPTLKMFQTAIVSRGKLTISVFLLNHQELFCGVGNWILNEVCYFSQVHPDRRISTLSLEEIDRIYQNIVEIISLGYQANGLTHGTFIDPDRQTGKYITSVYGKKVDPFGNPVIQIKMSCGRTGHIVPQLQF